MKKSKFLKSSKDMLSRSFNPSKCKTALRLAAARLKLLRNKKEAQVKQMRREISVLLESGQDQTARIRVEHVIREEKMMAAFDLIEIYCELIVARLPIIESHKICPIDLKEAITSIVFASPRCGDVPELVDARKQFQEKYGKEFITSAIELRPECGVSRMLVEKLSAAAPDVQTKTKILSAIAKEHGVEWDGESVEENSKPASDLLTGPSTSVKVNEQPTEPTRFQGPEIKIPQSNQLDSRTSHGTERLISSQVSSVNTAFPHEPRQQASGGDREQFFRSDSSSIPHDRPKWNMKFKDATAAAQAAAESAEMASMAARAAAELSRRDSFTRESNKSDDHSPRDEEIYRVNFSNTGGRYEAARDGRKEYSHSSSLQSKASIDDDSNQKNSFKEFSRSEKSMQRQSESVKKESTSNNVNIFSNSGQQFEYDAGWSFGKEDIHEEASPKSSRESAVFFDKSDSDNETDGFHISSAYDDEPPQVPLLGQKSGYHLSTESDSWSPSPKSSTSKMVKPPASVSLTRKSSSPDMYGSRLNDSVSVAFDESDGPTSESEDDTKLSGAYFSERKKSFGLHSNGSPHNTSPQFDSIQLPLSSGDESEEIDRERYQRKRFDADPPAKLNIWKPASNQPALVTEKNRTELNSSGNSSPEREEGLNFGKLTGGLRQKGFNYPSFGKNQLDVSLSKKERKEHTDTSEKYTKPDLQPTSDIDSSEEEEPLQNHKHKLHTISGGKDLKTKPSFVASRSVFGSENSDSDEDIAKESPSRTHRLRSGISRRTKALHEKEKLPKLQLRSEALDDDDDDMATTSISSEIPKRYKAKRIQESKVELRSEAHEQNTTKYYSTESDQQFQSLKGNSSQLRNSDRPKPTTSNSRYQHGSDRANSPLIQESKVGSKFYSAKEASMPQPKTEPSIRQENTLSKTNSNKDSGDKKASHVHPKPPGYDSQAHEQNTTKFYSTESHQQFQSLKWNSSQLRNSDQPKPTISNSRYQQGSEKSNSSLIQESKVGPKLSSAKEASMHQTKTEPSIRQENTLSKTNSNKDSGDKKASHVHPKLPDYDSFVQFFQKSRS